MADEVDLANEQMQSEVTWMVNQMRKQQAAAGTQGAKECVECGDAIPKERQKLGFKRCVHCASEIERRRALSGLDR